jgi:hypothetical protein
MAFKKIILTVTLLLSVMAATSASVAGDQCVQGQKIPHNPLPSCEGYVVSHICGVGQLPLEVMEESCCQELSAIPRSCRCEALRILMDRLVTVDVKGVLEGGPPQQCPRQWQRGFAAILVAPEECNLETTLLKDPYCLSLANQVAV